MNSLVEDALDNIFNLTLMLRWNNKFTGYWTNEQGKWPNGESECWYTDYEGDVLSDGIHPIFIYNYEKRACGCGHDYENIEKCSHSKECIKCRLLYRYNLYEDKWCFYCYENIEINMKKS